MSAVKEKAIELIKGMPDGKMMPALFFLENMAEDFLQIECARTAGAEYIRLV
jgi:hypothetical protein